MSRDLVYHGHVRTDCDTYLLMHDHILGGHVLLAGTVLYLLNGQDLTQDHLDFGLHKDYSPQRPAPRGPVPVERVLPILPTAAVNVRPGWVAWQAAAQGEMTALVGGIVQRADTVDGWTTIAYRPIGRAFAHERLRVADTDAEQPLRLLPIAPMALTPLIPTTTEGSITVTTTDTTPDTTAAEAPVSEAPTPEPDPTCTVAAHESAEAEAQAARASEADLRSRFETDLSRIGEMLMHEADRRDWCGEYDEIVRRINATLSGPFRLPERQFDYAVDFSVHGNTTLTVTGSGLSAPAEVQWSARASITITFDGDPESEDFTQHVDRHELWDAIDWDSFEVDDVDDFDVEDIGEVCEQIGYHASAQDLTGWDEEDYEAMPRN